MAGWEEYRAQARSRGALAAEFFVARSIPVGSPEAIAKAVPDHLAYQGELEARGALVLAGPLSDGAGRDRSGESLIVYRAASIEGARELADGDPMHSSGLKTYDLRAWLVNEGALELSLRLSKQSLSFR
jgi:uncharacterized protein